MESTILLFFPAKTTDFSIFRLGMINVLQFFKKYFFLILPVIYGILYLCGFAYVETHVTTDFHLVHMKIDDYIPFCKYFIIPYMLWFFYVAATILLFACLTRSDYYKLLLMLGTGMTLFLIISYVYPNGHMLRPKQLTEVDLFTKLIKNLYQTDTPTNLFPSIHCYNSLCCHFAINRSKQLKDKKWLQFGSFILCISIILSTLFIKQHSMFDVITAFCLFAPMYLVVYKLKHTNISAFTSEELS